jgi:NAD(P)-dependent dehydrogenase (short-subunit alcohol dehydrogenase family)
MNTTILITGAGSALGQALVKKLAAVGFLVIATMRGTQTKHLQTAQSLGTLENVVVKEMDVTDTQSVQQVVNEIQEAYGKIDVLINNAAIQATGLLEGYSIEQFHKVIDTNLYGVLRLYQQVLPGMRERGDGLILNISSASGRISTAYQVPYNSSRFALEGLVEGMYDELIGEGVENILVEPGPFIGGIYDSRGLEPDRQDVLESYSEDAGMLMAGFSARVGKAIQLYQPQINPIVEAVSSLIAMPKGTRPLRIPLDTISQGIDTSYNELSGNLRRDWIKKYMD